MRIYASPDNWHTCLFLSVCRILVTDISGVGGRRAMKLCRMVDLGVHQVISPFSHFGELWPRVSPPGLKVKINNALDGR